MWVGERLGRKDGEGSRRSVVVGVNDDEVKQLERQSKGLEVVERSTLLGVR